MTPQPLRIRGHARTILLYLAEQTRNLDAGERAAAPVTRSIITATGILGGRVHEQLHRLQLGGLITYADDGLGWRA